MEILTALFWLSLNCYHECRGEPELGKAYVTAVVLNRSEKSGKSIKEVILKENQFSWTSSDTLFISEPKELLSCTQSVLDAINLPIRKDITHYHATYVKPRWAKKLRLAVTIGKHKFYKERI